MNSSTWIRTMGHMLEAQDASTSKEIADIKSAFGYTQNLVSSGVARTSDRLLELAHLNPFFL
jgi:hypothetical protein